MDIRKVKHSELNDVVDMWKELADDQFQYDNFFVRSPHGHINMKNQMKGYLKDNNCLLLGSFLNEKMIGYALAQISEYPPYFENTRYCNLRHIFVKPSYRNIKYGAQIVQYVKNWAKEKGVKRIELLVASKNDNAIRFYRNLGFYDFIKQMAFDI